MAKKIRLEGIEDVTDGLNKAFKKIKKKSTQALIDVAILIRNDMEKTSPLIPIDTGNLRASWYSVVSKGNQVTPAPFKGKDAGKRKNEYTAAVTKAQNRTNAHPYPSLIMGFSANYAVYVHEMIDADFISPRKRKGKITKRRKGAGAKFFQKAMERNASKMMLILTNKIEL